MFTNWLTSSTTTSTMPPDVVLEVGPPPYVRYAAHSSLLSAHSGYLRSAIRPEDRNLDTPIYLPNITPEQFAPLLTYIYTGFLDLSIENIFGVLLATHVLHMPRALEICRAFLSRTQSEGYLGGQFLPTLLNNNNHDNHEKYSANSAVKIIRPIASKAAGTGVGFVAPPVAGILLPSRDTPFKVLHQERERSPIPGTSTKPSSSSSTTQPVKELQIPAVQNKSKTGRGRKKSINFDEKTKPSKAGFESVEDLSKTEDKSSKIIIDIASCDGPVRFLRVLNDAYGRLSTNSSSGTTIERNVQHVTTSFHLQMAKNISERSQQQQQQQQNISEESENSQEIIVEDRPTSTNNNNNSIPQPGKSEELYSCVYCKHTFKSQYCYQKHAKRHLNPLRIDGEIVVESLDSGSEKDEKGNSTDGSATAVIVRREVRPLDMNVQYYPCKTCGSKFPSYYFVHKHRKMCHANEEN